MKKPLLLLSLISTFNCLPQASSNRAYHSINEKAHPVLVNINGEKYFATVDQGALFTFGTCYLYKHNSSGNLQFRSTVLGGKIPMFGIKTLDDHLLLVSRHGMCDVIMPPQMNSITKINNSGTQVFSSTFTTNLGEYPVATLQHNDSSFFTFTGDKMFKHSKSGQLISETNLGLTDISSAILLQNNTILLSCKLSGVNSLIEINPAGNVLSIISVTALLNKMIFYGGQKIMGLGLDGKLYKVSGSHHLIGSSNFSGVASIRDFTLHNDTVYCIGTSTGTVPVYFRSDTLFVSSGLSPTTTELINQEAIIAEPASVSVLSTGASKTSFSYPDHYFTTLNTFAKTGSNNFQDDIALLAINVDSAWASCQLWTSGSYHYSANLRPKVTIKNKGPQPVTSFKLNCFIQQGVTCGSDFYQDNFSNFVLQPGDSMTLTASTFVSKNAGSYTNSTTAVTATYCMYTTLPNGRTDKTLFDNELCRSFNMSPTSISQQTDLAKEIHIFPNPSENRLNIESEITLNSVEITNALGVFIKKMVINDTRATLQNTELATGVYFLEIDTEKGSFVKKIIKD